MGCGASQAEEPVDSKMFTAMDVDKVLALSRSGIVANQKKAIQLMLRMASTDDKLRVKLAQGGGLDSIISMLKSQSKSVKVLAAKVLGRMALATANRPKLVEEGAIVPMIDFVKDPNMPVKLIGIDVLHTIALYPDARPKIVAEDIVKHLLPLLEQDDLEIELSALMFIARLSAHQKSHLKLTTDGVVPYMFNILRSPMRSVKHKKQAIICIAELSTHVENHRWIADGQGLKVLVGLSAFYAMDVRVYAAISIARLSENPLLRQPFVKEGVLPFLGNMLKQQKSEVLAEYGVKALKYLALDPLNQVKILKSGCLPDLLRLARCGNDTLEASSAMCLAVLATNNINRPKMLAAGAFKPLIYNSRFGHTQEIKDTSMAVLAGLFHTEAFRRKLLVRRACDKFKLGLRRKKQKHGVTAAETGTFKLQEEDDDASDEDDDY